MLLRRKKSFGKKGVSIVIGYILLISVAIVIGAVVFQWMKNLQPGDKPECPEGVSIMVREAECLQGYCEGEMNFDCEKEYQDDLPGCVEDYRCKATGDGGCVGRDCEEFKISDQCLPNIGCSWTNEKRLKLELQNNGFFDIEAYKINAATQPGLEIATTDISENHIGSNPEGGVVSSPDLEPNKEITHTYNLTNFGDIYLLEITPMKVIEKDNRQEFVTCGDSKIREKFVCETT